MSEESSFTETANNLKNLPMTWYPAILRVLIEESYQKNVWEPSGASRFVQFVEKEKGFDK